MNMFKYIEDEDCKCCYKPARSECRLTGHYFCSRECQQKKLDAIESESEIERIAEITSGGQI